jgi:hypothetical protein
MCIRIDFLSKSSVFWVFLSFLLLFESKISIHRFSPLFDVKDKFVVNVIASIELFPLVSR